MSDASSEPPVLFSLKPTNDAPRPKEASIPRVFTAAQNFRADSIHEMDVPEKNGVHDLYGAPLSVHTLADRVRLLDEAADGVRGTRLIIVDDPAPFVRRITLNRPERMNAMDHLLRAQLFEALRVADQDPSIRVTIIRGSGKSFCAGYDLAMDKSMPLPRHEAGGLGRFQRSVVSMWMMMMDLAKPVIAQVHGYCLAGGSELAAACDIVIVADDAKIGYPAIRSMGLPDMQIFPWVMNFRDAMYLMLTGDSMTGAEAVAKGWATRGVPAAELEAETMRVAARVARIPADLLQFNKRSVHRAMEAKGLRTHLRTHTDLSALSQHSPTSKVFMDRMAKESFFSRDSQAINRALERRDDKFGDNRSRRKGKSKL